MTKLGWNRYSCSFSFYYILIARLLWSLMVILIQIYQLKEISVGFLLLKVRALCLLQPRYKIWICIYLERAWKVVLISMKSKPVPSSTSWNWNFPGVSPIYQCRFFFFCWHTFLFGGVDFDAASLYLIGGFICRVYHILTDHTTYHSNIIERHQGKVNSQGVVPLFYSLKCTHFRKLRVRTV